jgi:hypothetical protein
VPLYREEALVRAIIAVSILVLLIASPLLRAQSTEPPSISQVQITSPQSTPGEPWRTSRSVIPLSFTCDAANGQFVANSQGGEVPFSYFLGPQTSGKVGVGFTREGSHSVSVLVAAVDQGPGPGGTAQAQSATVTIVYDRTAPTLQILRIRVNDEAGFEPYSAATVYYTNASAIGLQGVVRDLNSPSEEIRIRSKGLPTVATAQADSSGRWSLEVSMSGLDDGNYDLSVVAEERMSDGTWSHEGPPIPVRVGR